MTSTKYDIIFPSIDLFAKELSELDDHQLGFSKELIYGRWLVGILHSSAKLLDYNDFQKLRNEIGRKCRLWKLIGKIDLKYDFIVLLSIMYNKGAYYLLRKI